MTEAKAIAPSEAAFTATVLELARVLGWRVVHFRPARTARGWRTPVQGDGAGFPDVVLVKPPRVIFAELKSDTGTVSPQQRAWLDALGRCPGVEAHVWRPRDLREIEASLRARPDQTSPKCSESKPVTRENASASDLHSAGSGRFGSYTVWSCRVCSREIETHGYVKGLWCHDEMADITYDTRIEGY
jgi:hypothetical protein